MSKNTVTFRLRKIDSDLSAAIKEIDSATLSDLCRDGLRLALGIRTTKRMESTEYPLTFPVTTRTAAIVNNGRKPTVYRPGK